MIPMCTIPKKFALALVGFGLLLSSYTSTAFAPLHYMGNRAVRSHLFSDSEDSSSSVATEASATDDPLGLTPELRRLTDAFEAIGDDKLRYKQLLYMANQLAPMDESLKVSDNQVPGCLSTVHVHATPEKDGDATSVVFTGDSDGLLTKGLVALLVRGLSGNSPESIQTVDPSFIKQAGISASLTPGRNNGFLNMLATMKKKAKELESATGQEDDKSSAVSEEDPSSSSQSDRPMYDAIISNLQKLQPVKLELTDNSHQHAGHAGAKGLDGESHFDLYIVSDAFDGLNLVKRHQLIYMMLGEVMPKIHALQIRAQTTAEAGL